MPVPLPVAEPLPAPRSRHSIDWHGQLNMPGVETCGLSWCPSRGGPLHSLCSRVAP